jgi:hypothetical protein
MSDNPMVLIYNGERYVLKAPEAGELLAKVQGGGGGPFAFTPMGESFTVHIILGAGVPVTIIDR